MTGLQTRIALLLFAAGSVLPAAPRAASAQEPYAGIDAYVVKAMQNWKIPGLSIGIVRNDSVIYAKGFGVLNAGSHTAVNDQTLFEIGSTSKAFTSTLVAMLVTDGKMHFDDLVSTYLPDFKLYDPIASSSVTIRDALSHRSGIGRGDLIWSYSGITRAEVLHRIRFLKPESPFRSKYSYQNIMVMAAGESAAKAGGSPWEDLVTQRIFVPLGMTSTIPTFQRLNTTNVAKPDAMNHDTAYTLPVFFPGADIAPAGAILSNVRDMAQWLRFQLNDGVVNGKRLVSSAALRETHTPQILTGAARVLDVDSVPLTNFSAYGLAWTIQDYRGQLMWTHGGNTTGMTTAVGIIPEKKFGVVVLSNMASAQLPAVLMRYIIDHHLGVKVRDLSAEAYKRTQPQRDRADSVEKAQAAEHKAGTVAPLPLETYAGTFADSMYGEAVVALKDGRLELTRGEQHGALVYWNANNFRWTPGPVGGSYIKFEITPDNRVTGMYWGSGADMDLLARKDAGGRGGRGARGGAGRGRQ